MSHVAIIGGGLAGLSCAFALRQRGISAIVFEAAGRCGGRAGAAPYFLGRNVYTNTFRLIRDLGLESGVRDIEPVAGQLYRGQVHYYAVTSATGLLRFRGLNIADKAMLPRMALLLSRYKSKLDIHHPEFGIEFDRETVAAFVKRELSQNILNYIAGPLISTLFFYSSEETSSLLYLNLARHMHNTRLSTLHGGSQELVNRLQQQVEVRLDSPVQAVITEESGYRVNGSLYSDVVIAVPGHAVMQIEGLPALLTEKEQQFFADCRYGRAVSVSFDTPRKLGQGYGISIPRVEGLHASAITFHDFIDPRQYPGEIGRVTVTGGGEHLTAEQLLADFERISGEKISSSPAIHEWTAALPKFPPGRFRQVAEFRAAQPRNGLHFCGDYLLAPLIEAAVTSGTETAERIIARES